MDPMLAHPTDLERERLQSFLGPEWYLQQKLDGTRLLIATDGAGEVSCFNRSGLATFGPSDVEAAMAKVPFPMALDGEVVGGKLVVFDAPLIANAVTADMPLRDRLAALERIVPALALPLTVARTARDVLEKEAMLADVRDGDGEGWVAKRVLSTYVEGEPGRATRSWRKLKRYKDVDCIVEYLGSPDTNDKQNLGLALYDDGELVNVGECTRLAGTGWAAKPGSVVSVQILYATDDNRLYQPTRPRVRDDKRREDCTIDQLDYLRTNKRLVLT